MKSPKLLVTFRILNYWFNSSILLLFFGLLSSYSHSQFNISSDLYIGENAEMHIAVDETTFDNGIIKTDRKVGKYGLLSFASTAKWEGASTESNVDGFIRIYDNEIFSFPTSNESNFQPAMIKRTTENSPVDLAFFNTPHSSTTKEFTIKEISPFYWTVYGNNPAVISFSWTPLSDLSQLTNSNLNDLSILGFDGSQWRLIDAALDDNNFYDNSSVTLLSGSISSKNPVNLEGYEAYTLGSLDNRGELTLVSQGFTPNGDGINDTWYIENIEKFPNAEISVYNRWGAIVFKSLGNYDNNNGWNGTYKGNNELLPDAPYLYIITTNKENMENISGWIYITQ